MENKKKIPWTTLAFMAFSTVWGFGNVVNGFGYFNGVQAIFSWILIFALYFVPYALMVGELGSAFKEEGGGVSSWIRLTMGRKMAYYAGWTYWVVHMPYIAQKPNGALTAISWLITGSGDFFKQLDPMLLQGACLLVFLVFVWVASKGLNPLKNLTSIAGTSMFIMSILFIVLIFFAPLISTKEFVQINWTMENLIPKFDWKYFSSISILIYAVGGCEKISPYVNKVENPSKGFPKGMIALAIMVAICAILGTIGLGMMFDPATMDQAEFISFGAYQAFAQLGDHLGIGTLLMRVYALANVVGQLSTLVISIDAPTRMLLDSEDAEFIPDALKKKNKNGVYINGYKLMAVIVAIIIIVPALGIGNVTQLLKTFTDINSVTMPLRYVFVFLAYIYLKKDTSGQYKPEYQFTKSKGFGIFVGFWCMGLTVFASACKIFETTDLFLIALRLIIPAALIGLGFILPMIAKKTNKQVPSEEK